MNWISDIDNYGMNCVYVEIEADGFTYELLAIDNVENCFWHLYTTELFGCEDGRVTHTTLAEGVVATVEEGKNIVTNAFDNREKYRQKWIEILRNAI